MFFKTKNEIIYILISFEHFFFQQIFEKLQNHVVILWKKLVLKKKTLKKQDFHVELTWNFYEIATLDLLPSGGSFEQII